MTAPMAFAEQMRLRTHAQHQQMEQTSVARSLMSKTLTLAACADILLTWRNARSHLAKAIWTTRSAQQVPNLLPAKRGTKADIDLRSLTAQHAIHPRLLKESVDRDLASPQTLASYAGVCYVLQGALLGGKVIARHLAMTLGLTALHGAAFFSAGEEDATWREWIQQADTLVQDS